MDDYMNKQVGYKKSSLLLLTEAFISSIWVITFQDSLYPWFVWHDVLFKTQH